jgi:hypothetical protein
MLDLPRSGCAPFLIGAAIAAIVGCITVPQLLRDTGEKITA